MRASLVLCAPLALAALLYVMASTGDRRLYDVCFVAFHLLFELMRVLCDAEGARCVARISYEGAPRFALVSGLSTTATLLLQTAMQLLFVRPTGLGLPLAQQFKVLSGLLLALFVACAASAAASVTSWCARRPLLPLPDDGSSDGSGGAAREAESQQPYQEYSSDE